jgi:type II secretory pathway pseudopilin PulG
MIITAIIAMLVAIGAPSLRAYANKSRIAQVTATASAIRAALETSAIDTQGSYPPAASLSTWENWRDFLRQYSTPMPATSIEAGIRSITYTSADLETYNVHIVVNVPDGVVGKNIVLTPQGIEKH